MAVEKLYAIVDRATLDARGITVRAFAEELREGGVRLVQYRDKLNRPQEILRAARELDAVFAGTDAKLVMNDRADLAAMLGWGVHVGQGDLPLADARKLVSTVGVSTHNKEQVRKADATDAKYLAVGPVFGTQSKADAEPAVGLEGVRAARTLTQKPLVAIGGITLANFRDVLAAGADSVAVISGLFVEGCAVRDVVAEFLAG